MAKVKIFRVKKYLGISFVLHGDYLKLENEIRELREEWFKKGQMSVKRNNKSGCCCIINDDDTIESLCCAHKDYIKALEGK